MKKSFLQQRTVIIFFFLPKFPADQAHDAVIGGGDGLAQRPAQPAGVLGALGAHVAAEEVVETAAHGLALAALRRVVLVAKVVARARGAKVEAERPVGHEAGDAGAAAAAVAPHEARRPALRPGGQEVGERRAEQQAVGLAGQADGGPGGRAACGAGGPLRRGSFGACYFRSKRFSC